MCPRCSCQCNSHDRVHVERASVAIVAVVLRIINVNNRRSNTYCAGFCLVRYTRHQLDIDRKSPNSEEIPTQPMTVTEIEAARGILKPEIRLPHSLPMERGFQERSMTQAQK